MASKISRPTLLVTAFLFLVSILVPIIIPKQAEAASIYDDLITRTSEIGVNYNWPAIQDPPLGHASCTAQPFDVDHTWNWLTYFNSPEAQVWDDGNLDAFTDRLNGVVDGSIQGGWGITSWVNDDYYSRSYRMVVWTGTPVITWSPSTVEINGANNTLWYIDLDPYCNFFNGPQTIRLAPRVQPSNGNMRIDNTFTRSFSPVSFGNSLNYQMRINFLSGDYNPSYPVGYEGAMIPSENESYENTAPEMVVEVDGFNITGIYGSSPDDFQEGVNRDCIMLNWRISNLDTPQIGDVVTYSLTQQNIIKYTASIEGNYSLELEKTYDTFTCGENEHVTGYKKAVVLFTVTGQGKQLVGFNNCSTTGSANNIVTCDGRSTGEELCEYNGIGDIATFAICQMRNFFRGLKDWFLGLFMVRPEFLNQALLKFNAAIQENNSFLTYTLAWFTGTSAQIAAQSANCEISGSGQAIFGAYYHWDLCEMQYRWPALWTLVTTVVRMAYVLLILSLCYKAYVKLWNN